MWSYKNCRHPSIHIMMTSSNGSIFRVTGSLGGEFVVTGEFPSQKPVTRSFDVFFDLHLNKRLRKQSRRRWFEGVVRFPFDGLAHNAGFHFTTSQIDFSKIVYSFTIVNWETFWAKWFTILRSISTGEDDISRKPIRELSQWEISCFKKSIIPLFARHVLLSLSKWRPAYSSH